VRRRPEVPYGRDVDRTQSRRPYPLQDAQHQEQAEVRRERAGYTGDAEEEEGRDQNLAPSVPVRENARDRREQDAGERKDRYQQPHLRRRDTELVLDLREGRRNARGAEHGHQRDAEDDVQIVVLIDWPVSSLALSLRRLRHERGMYQAETRRVAMAHTTRR
jgi:hypothetical protein